jgi:hypothetical protein
MARLKESRFTMWEMNPVEEKEGSRLSDMQFKRIQTLQAQAAEQLVSFKLDPAALQESLQQQAFLNGQVTAYQHLLDSHLSVITILSDEE